MFFGILTNSILADLDFVDKNTTGSVNSEIFKVDMCKLN